MKKVQRLHLLAAIALVILGVSSATAQIVCVPETLELDEVNTFGDVVITYNGGGTANVYGYSVEIAWDSSLATATFSLPDTPPFDASEFFQFVEIAPGQVLVDGAIGGDHLGIESGDLFKVTFTAEVGALGTTGIGLTIESLRDPGNLPVTGVSAQDGILDVDMVGIPKVENILIVNNTLLDTNDFVKDGDSITITADVTDYDGLVLTDIEADLSVLGGSATENPDTYADPVATWTLSSVTCSPADGPLSIVIQATDGTNTGNNSGSITADNTAPTALTGVGVTPGYQKLHLEWDDFSSNDLNIKGIEFRYNTWGVYPFYDDPEPAYPATNTEGTLAKQVESGITDDWTVTPPDIYYVAGFVYDMALNYSDAGIDNQGRATNYWLGDIDGSGQVDVTPDIDALGDTYGLLDGEEDFDEFCNVGPTFSGSPRGIPNPNGDNRIGFEDMMIFALNWNVVDANYKAATGGTQVLAWRQVDETTWSLNLVENGGGMQGLNLRAELPEGVDCTVDGGDLLADQSGPVFLRNIPQHGVDAGLALFGQGSGFSGSGELVRVNLSKPVDNIDISVTARDAENKELSVEWGTGSPETVPTVASFAQNYPNPFNPRTTLSYELPQERQVHLAIYAVDGTRIRTLVEGLREAGHHEVSWDGRDDTGRSMAAGTYFARISAGDLNQIKKMVLVK